MENVKEKYKSKILEIIKKLLPTCTIYLFGSRANGTVSFASDIDVAIDNKEQIPMKILGEIQEQLEESNIPFEVDVVDLQRTDEKFRNKVLRTGMIWKD